MFEKHLLKVVHHQTPPSKMTYCKLLSKTPVAKNMQNHDSICENLTKRSTTKWNTFSNYFIFIITAVQICTQHFILLQIVEGLVQPKRTQSNKISKLKSLNIYFSTQVYHPKDNFAASVPLNGLAVLLRSFEVSWSFKVFGTRQYRRPQRLFGRIKLGPYIINRCWWMLSSIYYFSSCSAAALSRCKRSFLRELPRNRHRC